MSETIKDGFLPCQRQDPGKLFGFLRHFVLGEKPGHYEMTIETSSSELQAAKLPTATCFLAQVASRPVRAEWRDPHPRPLFSLGWMV